VNLLDENIFADQRRLLHRWRIRVHHIGYDVGRAGMDDDQIISFLHQQPGTTFFTRDRDFWERGLCHARYCLVCLFVKRSQTASFVRRFLQHPSFVTRARRMGKVVAVRPERLLVWNLRAEERMDLAWP
jgi:uncharacterized protein DUF5615